MVGARAMLTDDPAGRPYPFGTWSWPTDPLRGGRLQACLATRRDQRATYKISSVSDAVISAVVLSQFPQFNFTANIAGDTESEICRATRVSNQFTARVKPVNCLVAWLSATIRVIRGFNCGSQVYIELSGDARMRPHFL